MPGIKRWQWKDGQTLRPQSLLNRGKATSWAGGGWGSRRGCGAAPFRNWQRVTTDAAIHWEITEAKYILYDCHITHLILCFAMWIINWSSIIHWKVCYHLIDFSNICLYPDLMPGFFSGASMATHSSTPTWRILRTEEPGELQSMGSQKAWPQLSDWALFCSKFPALSLEHRPNDDLDNKSWCLLW